MKQAGFFLTRDELETLAKELLTGFMEQYRPPAEPKDLPDLVSVKEAAELLTVSQATIHRMKKEGRLTGRMIGGSVRFCRADVLAIRDNKKSGK